MTEPASETAGAAEQPALQITGDPTPEEVAAVVTVLQAVVAARAAAAPTGGARPSEWAAPHRRHRQLPRTGPGAWTASALPR